MLTGRRFGRAALLALVLAACISASHAAGALPSRLTDQEFWALINEPPVDRRG